ncbi:hypothetical protein Goari_016273, partial [Gossypium aridum]|nr:hypothetical protein [Gossypium aridum]
SSYLIVTYSVCGRSSSGGTWVKVAHAVAQRGMSRTEDCFWVKEASLLATFAANEDRRSLDPPQSRFQ